MPIGVSKPTRSMRWATDGAADLVDPPSGKRDVGWIDAEEPPAEYFNELLRAAYDWQQYLEDATDELNVDKIDRDGSVTMAGNFLPDGNGTRSIGSNAAKFATGHFTGLRAPEAAKAWGTIEVSAGGVPTLIVGNNLDTPTVDTDGIVVSLTNDLSATSYVVVVTGSSVSNADVTFIADFKAAGSFKILVRNSAGALLNLTSGNFVRVDFVVLSAGYA